MKHEQILKLVAILMVACADACAEERNRIVVSIPDRKLVVMNGARVVKVYDVAVGKESTPSPRGEFRIVNKIANPTYYKPGAVIAPGKSNPLGTRWMGLNERGYGIHGTNAPSSIGKAASHGCIRMRQRDLEELFDMVTPGTVVELDGERPAVMAQVLAGAKATAD